MKIAKTLVTAALLLIAAVAVHAAGTEVAPEPVAAASTPAVDCDAEAGQALIVGLPSAITADTMYCGSCSTSNCVGAPRGQICSLGSGRWGHCNIFSGGYVCTDGSGWECQCSGGVLP